MNIIKKYIDQDYIDEVGVYEGYYDKECNINKFDKEFNVYSLRVSIFCNNYKINHKNKFFISLHDELMKVAWNPNRYKYWCLDFQELRYLEERWAKSK